VFTLTAGFSGFSSTSDIVEIELVTTTFRQVHKEL
jgi:hypothetical protein